MILENEDPPRDLNDQQCQIWRVFNRARNTAIMKNADYGGSVFERPIFAPNLKPDSAILVRISDKIRRAIRLLAGVTAMVSESLRDTMMDLGTYCLLWVVLDEMRVANGDTSASLCVSGDTSPSLCMSCRKNGTSCPVPLTNSGAESVRSCVEYEVVNHELRKVRAVEQ